MRPTSARSSRARTPPSRWTPIPFTKGLSDGLHTEVASGQVEPGMEVVIDEATAPP